MKKVTQADVARFSAIRARKPRTATAAKPKRTQAQVARSIAISRSVAARKAA